MYVRNTEAFLRLFMFFISTHVGRIIAGSLLVIGGLIYGMNSHQVNYHQNTQDTYSVRGVDDNSFTYYLQANKSSAYYFIKATDFASAPDMVALIVQGHLISLTYVEGGEKFDAKLEDGTHFTGQGYKVVQLVVAGPTGPQSFSADQYLIHSKSYYVNNWESGGLALGAGLLLWGVTGLVFWLDRRKRAEALDSSKKQKDIKIVPNDPWRGVGGRKGVFSEPVDPRKMAQ